MSAFMLETNGELRRAHGLAQGMKSASFESLLEAWSGTRARAGDAPAIYDTSGGVLRRFTEIEDEARGFERELLGEFRSGDVIAIQIGNHAAWPALLLACLRKRLVALPLERTIAARERDVALKICHAAAIVEAETAIALRKLPHEKIDWGTNRPVLLKLTSGPPAVPRAIRFRSEQLLADCTQICETMGITSRDLNFGVIPLSHSYGFSNLLTSLVALGVPMVLSRDRMPRALLDDLARTNATVFPSMPVFYQTFSEMDHVPALPRLRLCISAGAPLPLEVARKFRERFKHSIHSFYGSP